MQEEPGLLSPTGVLADVKLLDGTVYRGGVRLERRTPDSDEWIYHLWDVSKLENGEMAPDLIPGVWVPTEQVKVVEALDHDQADRYEARYGIGADVGLRMMEEDEAEN